MCTNPRQVFRFRSHLGLMSQYDVVPCGKCSECRNIARSEIATKAVVESSRRSNLWLLTFTYDNDKVPLSFTPRVISSDGEILQQEKFFLCDPENRSELISEMILAYRKSKFYNSKSPNGLLPITYKAYDLLDDSFVAYRVTPSLDRTSWRLWLKRFRVQYKRSHGESLSDFSYMVFGEYGDHTARPHFHCLISGLSNSEIFEMSLSWRSQFGRLDHRKVEKINPDGSPGFIKSAKYISKYIGKNNLSLEHDLSGYVEKPRKCSSIGFGKLSDEEVKKYRVYYLAFDYVKYNPDCPKLGDKRNLLLAEIVQRSKNILFDGESLLLPKSYKKQIFYKPYYKIETHYVRKSVKGSDETEVVGYTWRRLCYRPTKIQNMVVQYQRDSYNADFIREFSEYTGEDFHKASDMAYISFCSHLQTMLQDRETFASSTYLNSLFSQKFN